METFRRILTTAVQGGASDVHLKIGTPIVFRINRKLVVVEGPMPTEEWMNMVVETIVPRHTKAQLQQEHECDFSYYLPEVGRFRTNCFYQRGQPCLAMRFVKTQVPSFEELGLLPVLRQIAESPRGIVLLAGSTGCGKSTTLAAMVEHINANSRKHIITLEDPIEYVFEDNQSVIEQREIGLDTLILRARPQVRPAPGPGRHHDRGNARRHQFHRRHERGGHRPPGLVHPPHHQRRPSRRAHPGFLQAGRTGPNPAPIAGTLQAVVCQRMVPTIAGGMTPAQEIMINSGTVRKLIEENRLEKLAAAIETGQRGGNAQFQPVPFPTGQGRQSLPARGPGQGDQRPGAGDELPGHLPDRRQAHPGLSAATVKKVLGVPAAVCYYCPRPGL